MKPPNKSAKKNRSLQNIPPLKPMKAGHMISDCLSPSATTMYQVPQPDSLIINFETSNSRPHPSTFRPRIPSPFLPHPYDFRPQTSSIIHLHHITIISTFPPNFPHPSQPFFTKITIFSHSHAEISNYLRIFAT